jgi:hypothetical protein
MATSVVQIEANRANAQHSTGPRTDEGKRASSTNATTTGLTSLKIFVRPEEQADFDTLESNLLAEMQPAGQIQLHHFELILHATWNIRRCLLLEAEIQNEAIAKGLPDAILDEELSRKLDRVYRYKKMHESSSRRSTNDLRQLQTEQTRRNEHQELVEESVLVDTGKVMLGLQQSNVLESRSKLDNVRAQIESFIAPPPIRRT